MSRRHRLSYLPIYEDGQRSWDPERKCTQAEAEFVLDLLLEHGEMAQADICRALAYRFSLNGGGSGTTSATLLYLRQQGLIESTKVMETDHLGHSMGWRPVE